METEDFREAKNTDTACNWIVALNNYDDEDVKHLSSLCVDSGPFKAFYAGFEVGEKNGLHHIQGYIETKERMGPSALSKILHHKWYNRPEGDKTRWVDFEKKFGGFCIAVCKKRANRIDYCFKGTQTKAEWKEHHQDGPNYGHDVKVFLRYENKTCGKTSVYGGAMEELLEGKTDFLTFASKNPEITLKHCSAVNHIMEAVKEKTVKDQLKVALNDIVLWPWQQQIVNECSKILTITDPIARKVQWIYDPKGCAGKSTLSNILHVNLGATILQNGKTADMMHAYHGERIICIDLTRTTDGFINYTAIEALMGPVVFSPKYNSKCKYRSEGAVMLVFSNFKPTLTTMSMDRWWIRTIVNNELKTLFKDGVAWDPLAFQT